MVWQVEVAQSNSLTNIAEMIATAMPSVEQTRAEATDMYTAMASASDLSVLPLVVAAYPSEASNSLPIITPSAIDGVTTKLTSTLDVTLPGSDLLVELFADIAWELAAVAYAQSAASGGSTSGTTGGGASHNHSVSVIDGSHTHSVAASTAAASGITLTVTTERHTHKILDYVSSIPSGYGGRKYHTDGTGSGHNLSTLDDSYAGALYSFIPENQYLMQGTASASSHTHSVSATIAGTVTAGTALTSSFESTHDHSVTVPAHTHAVGPTSALLDVKAELVIDDTTITANSSQFHVDGLSGKKGNIPLRSIYVLQKSTDKADALSSGQHTIGLKFTVTTVDFDNATSTVDANNIALIIRDAAFDDRVKIFTP